MKLENIRHPLFKDISLDARFYGASPAKPERGYSLGEPPEPARYEVDRIYWRGTDITDFVYDFADHMFIEFAEDLIRNNGKPEND